MFTYVSPTYTTWKTTKTTDALTAYYIQYDLHYVGILVDKVKQVVYRIDISRDGKDANQSDFETNIKGSATLVQSVDDAIAKAII